MHKCSLTIVCIKFLEYQPQTCTSKAWMWGRPYIISKNGVRVTRNLNFVHKRAQMLKKINNCTTFVSLNNQSLCAPTTRAFTCRCSKPQIYRSICCCLRHLRLPRVKCNARLPQMKTRPTGAHSTSHVRCTEESTVQRQQFIHGIG